MEILSRARFRDKASGNNKFVIPSNNGAFVSEKMMKMENWSGDTCCRL